ncbi:unnamed protein product [Moneuplotes crassus]|uniref:Uncharacterized protein n=1 Tax=Euplotes crassus TaxID=5936 RepID=A0AAD1UCK0_EUPCR|nr:unnamed protein product [Moneuplotes crassus]
MGCCLGKPIEGSNQGPRAEPSLPKTRGEVTPLLLDQEQPTKYSRNALINLVNESSEYSESLYSSKKHEEGKQNSFRGSIDQIQSEHIKIMGNSSTTQKFKRIRGKINGKFPPLSDTQILKTTLSQSETSTPSLIPPNQPEPRPSLTRFTTPDFIRVHSLIVNHPEPTWEFILQKMNEERKESCLTDLKLSVKQQARQLQKKYEDHFRITVDSILCTLEVGWDHSWDEHMKEIHRQIRGKVNKHLLDKLDELLEGEKDVLGDIQRVVVKDIRRGKCEQELVELIKDIKDESEIFDY